MSALRIVIADDDGVTLLALRKMLTELGHEVIGEAGDGQQAVKLVGETDPDLVFLDIRMPNLDGLAGARLIQSQRPTPVIMVSAYTEAGLGSEAAGAGAHGYIVKPFTAEQIKPAIELALTAFAKSRAMERKLHEAQEALESRKVIERAKGILMKQTGLDEEAAYLKLQKTARNENRKLVEVARAVITAEQERRNNFPDSTADRSTHRRML